MVMGVVVAIGVGPAAFGANPLETAMTDSALPSRPAATFDKMKAAGATVVRLVVDWGSVAPAGAQPPDGFVAADPSATGYRWQVVDAQVSSVVAVGLEPFIVVSGAPDWAQHGTSPAGLGPSRPDSAEFGQFARAIASRFSGRFDGLPRVRYWGAWSEPNLSPDLWPQLVGGRPVSPGTYRALVNAFSAGVKSVHADNLVVAGELAPFRDITGLTYAQDKDWGPLSFMRALLCLSPSLSRTCHDPVRFDIWSTHPYTSGGPTHHAVLPNDVSIADLPKMKAVLDAARANGEIVSSGPIRFWVTEFSWDSNPPDPHGVPTSLLVRWVPQAMYEFWRSGVTLVTWFSVRDEPMTTSFYQSGLYYRSGKAKPYREGFRFPFVAFPKAGGVYVWGRTPSGLPGPVAVEQRDNTGTWRTIGTLSSDSHGVFQHTYRLAQTGFLRAQFVGTAERSLPFSLTAVPDQFFNPFGGTTLLEPTPKK
jgi:hypothetical protein